MGPTHCASGPSQQRARGSAAFVERLEALLQCGFECVQVGKSSFESLAGLRKLTPDSLLDVLVERFEALRECLVLTIQLGDPLLESAADRIQCFLRLLRGVRVDAVELLQTLI